MAAPTRSAQRHADWIGMLQPDGLVVAVPVLTELELYLKQPIEAVTAFRDATEADRLPDLSTLLTLLGWPDTHTLEPDDTHRYDLPDLGVTLAPTRIARSRDEDVLWVQWVDGDLDATPDDPWPASHTERFERLLTRKGQPAGLLVCPTAIRLIHAPAGEASGRLTFPIEALRSPDGRLLIDALHMLLGRRRLFTPPRGKSLAEVLTASRQRQEQVTSELAKQVQDALEVLLAGIDDADAHTHGKLLRDVDPASLYEGLTTVLLRLVFLLYAEDRGLLPLHHPLYAEHYSVVGLADRLAAEATAHGEAQSRRYGAWAHLLSLFRMVWSGASHRGMTLPPRQGDLFQPDRFPFLEGRPPNSSHTTDAPNVPPVSDGVVHAVLHRLLHLEGQRISYRNLEVEQLGSVYEALMGFEVCKAATPAARLKNGCWVELGALLESEQPYLYLQDVTGDRNARLRKQLPDVGGLEITGDVDVDREAARQALKPLWDRSERRVASQRHYLQPGAERRNSGSHYTPRSLTEPIVRRTLEPLLGDQPTAAQILDLRVCDPAMGSGAFLAEVCRQLAEKLVEAWAREDATPSSKHEPLLVARRKIAEACLYGVDKNPRAVQLARLSLWLITSAPDLPFTFVDHNLKAGDALIGVTLDQLAKFSLQEGVEGSHRGAFISAQQSATRMRARITAEQREMAYQRDEHGRKKSFLMLAEEEVWDERQLGDLLVACAWDASRKTISKKREKAMRAVAGDFYPKPGQDVLPPAAQGLVDALPMRPFHWWLEFPEVFQERRRKVKTEVEGKTKTRTVKKGAGFDAVVGNPPFGGKNLIGDQHGDNYIRLLQSFWPHGHGKADYCAYFFLRASELLRQEGRFALVASNSIKQGKTLETGLGFLLRERGVTITRATTDKPWPVSNVAVVVDVVHGLLGTSRTSPNLNGHPCSMIGANLTVDDGTPEPVKLQSNGLRCFQGSVVLGKGFVLTPDEAADFRAKDRRNSIESVILPYIGGKELNNNVPTRPEAPVPNDRFVIDFGDRTVDEAGAWPHALNRLTVRVLPERSRSKHSDYRDYWWRHARRGVNLYRSISSLTRCIANSQVSKHLLLAFQPTDRVFSHALNVFALDTWRDFATLQSRLHEAWARDRGSSMKTDLRYTPSTCFATFPFPRPSPEQADTLATTGEALYMARQEQMVRDQKGMTHVWNRLHDPHDHDPHIIQLRELRDAMDHAVLDAYGWSDLTLDDTKGMVARLRKLNAERAAEEAALAAESDKPPKKKRSKR